MRRRFDRHRYWLRGWHIFALILLALSIPCAALAAEDAARQFAAAAALQNRQAYDLAIDEWTKFLMTFATDDRADRALYYRGVCYFQTKQYAQAAADYRRVLVDF